MRHPIVVLAFSTILLFPALAAAQEDGNCPPGGWFCEETEPSAQEPEGGEPEVVETPSENPTPQARRTRKPPPPVVVYQPEGEQVTVDEESTPPRHRRWRRKWGLNLHLEGIMMGEDPHKSSDSGMGGLGFSFRYRPIPHFAFDAGLDFVGGKDWQGNDRRETALLLNAMVYFNPRNPVQVYMLGGLGFSGAAVQPKEPAVDQNGNELADQEKHYSYFGGQMGIGLEFRVSHRVSLNLDVIGFIRGRTDEKAQTEPEFTDPDTGRTTNTSGGGLARGGITFYW